MGAAIYFALSASTFTFFNLGGGVSYGVATGGTSSSITVGGQNYTLLTFTSDDTLTVTKSGLFDVALIAGGGGAGGGYSGYDPGGAGGGGAGGVLISTIYLTANAAVTVGAGGAGGANNNFGAAGLASKIGTAISVAGADRANRRAVMTSKKISKAKRQIGDQTTKGGVIGIMIYALSTNNVDPVLIGLLVPVASSVLAWISTKIGDPDLACLFIPNDDDKPKN
jgi:hypothetical protein